MVAGNGFWGMETSWPMIIPHRVTCMAKWPFRPAIIVLTLIDTTLPSTIAISG